ncbi:MAG: 50S ribosomal protein L35 [Patescibacteria group bacterium]
MPKLKTIQSVHKRIRVTKTGKIQKKKAGQDHFNSRESGKVTRAKRRLVKLKEGLITKNIRKFLPYS